MSLSDIHTIRCADVAVPDAGWHYDDPALQNKLRRSLREHGQLRPLVVRTDADGRVTLVEGRQLLRALEANGETEAWAVDIGSVGDSDAVLVALSLGLHGRTDYVRLAAAVARLLDEGTPAESLALAAPMTAEQAEHYRRLVAFDWAQFSRAEDGQEAMSFDDGADVPGQGLGALSEIGSEEPEAAAPEPVRMPEPAKPGLPVAKPEPQGSLF